MWHSFNNLGWVILAPDTACIWTLNWLSEHPSMVQCPELWTLGAISLTSIFSFVLKNSTANTPTWSKLVIILLVISFAFVSKSFERFRGAYECLRMWFSWIFFVKGKWKTLPNISLQLTCENSNSKGIFFSTIDWLNSAEMLSSQIVFWLTPIWPFPS